MDISPVVARLSHNTGVFQALCDGVGDAQARWKPAAESWSILEVVCHLADEEVRDFRTRVDYTLHRPGTPWPAVDPQSWVVQERYNERSLAPSLAAFLEERTASVRWLERLAEPDWELATDHPSLGRLRAGDLLASWLAHDLIHVRQINRLHREVLEAEWLLGYDPSYAGAW